MAGYRFIGLEFEGTRGQILANIKTIFGMHNHVRRSKSGNSFVLLKINEGQNDECSIGLILLENGYLVETYFANQPKVYNRLWMCDPFMGRVSYLETDNPDLINDNITKFSPEMRHLELYGMPEDLELINNILKSAVNHLQTNQKEPASSIKLLELKKFI